MAESIGTEIRENDFVYLRTKAARELTYLREKMLQGGVVKSVRNGVAEVHITTVERIHVSKLTTGDDAYDPIP